jgi:hypothetical protein
LELILPYINGSVAIFRVIEHIAAFQIIGWHNDEKIINAKPIDFMAAAEKAVPLRYN